MDPVLAREPFQRAREVDELAIGAGDEGFAGETVRDVARDFGGGGAARDLARGAVGQGDADGFHFIWVR